MSAYQKVPTQQILSLEEEVYLESLAVLSEMDKHEELVRVTLDTPPASPGCSPMVRQHTLFSSPMARENDTDDGFYRNNEDTVQRIYSTEQSMEEDYWIRFQDLPEYKAYQCVRSLRKRKYSYVCWMTLLLLCSVLAVTKIYTTTLANSDNDSSAQSIHVKHSKSDAPVLSAGPMNRAGWFPKQLLDRQNKTDTYDPLLMTNSSLIANATTRSLR
jgi:hypothetical protein